MFIEVVHYIKKFFLKKFGLNTKVFTKIYKNKEWGQYESVSGSGSTLENTNYLIPQLETLWKKLEVKKLVDIPCGDFNWMKKVNLENIDYLGGDIVKDLIKDNQRKFQKKNINFIRIDLTRDSIPSGDVLFVRDCFVHLSYEDVSKAISNIIKSNNKYLITTTFVNHDTNYDIKTGSWRPINLEKYPFNFPKARFYLFEDCKEENGRYNDKHLGVWILDDLRK